jgi:hypothetical protein
MVFAQHTLEQSGFTGTQKAGQDSSWNQHDTSTFIKTNTEGGAV